MISGATNAVTATLPGVPYPIAVAANPTTNLVYIANLGSPTSAAKGTVIVANGTTPSTFTTIDVGDNPTAIGINILRNAIYVANTSNGTVGEGTDSVINGVTNAVVATIPVGSIREQSRWIN